MKQRLGFVSNSSSCSFQLVGICFETCEVLKEFSEDVRILMELDWLKNHSDKPLDSLDLENDPKKVKEFIDNYSVIANLNLMIECGLENKYIYFGLHPHYDMDANETQAEFHYRIRQQLKKLFDPAREVALHFYHEEWYDG